MSSKPTVQVPRSFGMFTAKGNAALRASAEKALRKLEDLSASGNLAILGVSKILVGYIVDWHRIAHRKGCTEASDTAVREEVGAFHDTLWNRYGGSGSAWDAWERHRSDAWRMGEAARAKKKF